MLTKAQGDAIRREFPGPFPTGYYDCLREVESKYKEQFCQRCNDYCQIRTPNQLDYPEMRAAISECYYSDTET